MPDLPGSGPPEPDLVLDAIRDGATFARVKGELGVLDVNGVLHRIAIKRAENPAGAWYLDPDAGGYLTGGTFEALHAWAISAHRGVPVTFDEGQGFALEIVGDSVAGVPIVRVAFLGPVEVERTVLSPAL